MYAPAPEPASLAVLRMQFVQRDRVRVIPRVPRLERLAPCALEGEEILVFCAEARGRGADFVGRFGVRVPVAVICFVVFGYTVGIGRGRWFWDRIDDQLGFVGDVAEVDTEGVLGLGDVVPGCWAKALQGFV